jgi:rubrerythrin
MSYHANSNWPVQRASEAERLWTDKSPWPMQWRCPKCGTEWRHRESEPCIGCKAPDPQPMSPALPTDVQMRSDQ